MDRETTFTLSELITFANKEIGDEDKTYEITLKAPTYREMDQAARMEQHIYQAFSGAAAARKGDERPQTATAGEEMKMSGGEMMIMLSTYCDLPTVLRDFEKLLLKRAFFNEKTELLKKHVEQITIADYRRLCGEYLGFFILPSVILEMETAFSDS